MNNISRRKMIAVLSSVLLLFGTIAGCSTLEAGVEQPAMLNLSDVGTLAAFMYQGTSLAMRATQRSLEQTPIPPAGTVKGKICYPSGHIPPMTVYFRNLSNDFQSELQIHEFQITYTVELTPGDYYAYAWVRNYQLGGLYSAAVLCGLSDACNDHRPLNFKIIDGQITSQIDLCDWVIPADQLPVPPGYKLPGLQP
jgi:hypothetical protein